MKHPDTGILTAIAIGLAIGILIILARMWGVR